MRSFARVAAVCTLGFVMSALVHPSVPLAQNGPPADRPDQGDLNRADPCANEPDAQGQAKGIDKRCTQGGSAGVAKGDFNGDGVADLAVGIPNETVATLGSCNFRFECTTIDHPGAGKVNIIYGSTSNGLVRPTPGQPQVLQGSPIADNGHFGRALASGNFRGNATSDLAVGQPGVQHNGRTVGAINVFFSNTNNTGLSSVQPNQVFFGDQFSSVGSTLGDNVIFTFPEDMSMTWGDFNGDSVGDLAVEARIFGNSNPRSVALVLYGAFGAGLSNTNFTLLVFDDGLNPNLFTPDPNGVCDRLKFCANSRGKITLASSDINNDGKAELLIGAPNCNAIRDDGSHADAGFNGCVAIVPGHSGALTKFGWGALLPGTEDRHHGFGLALAVGDFDHDSAKDVAVGSPDSNIGAATAAGGVRIFKSVSAGSNGTGELGFDFFTQNTQGIETAEANDHFGASLAANDFNGDGATDLAVGVPGEDSGASTGNGQVDVIFGLAGTGLSTTASTGHPGVQKILGGNNGEALGSSLSAWNFGFTSEADLAIGAPFFDLPFFDLATGGGGTISGAGAVVVFFGQSTNANGFQSSAQVWVQQPPVGSPLTGPFTTADVARAGNHFGNAVY